MDKQVFKPSWSKITAWWLLMTLTVLLFFTACSLSELRDLIAVMIVVGYAFIACLVFMSVFYSLPYFRVEVNDAQISGPGPVVGGWQRVKIPLNEFDVRKVKCLVAWLGIYKITSNGHGTINMWAFDEKGLEMLLKEIRRRKASVQPTASPA